MPLRVTTPPAAMPVTVAEAKQFCRIDQSDDDDLVAELIESATVHIQQVTGLQLVSAEFELTLAGWPRDSVIRLPRSPFVSLTSLQCRTTDEVGLSTLEEGTDFFVDDVSMPALVYPKTKWPSLISAHDAVIATWVAGFPGEGSPIDHTATVPSRAKVAVKSLTAHWYEHREPAAFGAMHKVPQHIDTLLNGLRIWRVS